MILRSLLASSLLLLGAGRSLSQEAAARGRKLFDSHCARCHGIGGGGGEGPSLARPTLGRAADEEALASVIQNGIEGTDMPPAWQISENEVREIAAYVRSLGRVEPEKLEGGDRERGRALFEGEGGCSNCHVVDGKGGILGPDLSEVGLRRGASYLRESLVSPAAVVSEDFLQVRAVFKGQEVSGVRVNEDSFTIQLRDPSGRFHSLPKLELETLEKGFGESLMPSYGSELTEDEIEDLVAYLAGLRGEP